MAMLVAACNWFLLVNGGDSTGDSMQNSIIELKTILDTFLSNNLLQREEIVLLNALDEILFGDVATLKLVTPQIIINILEGKHPISHSSDSKSIYVSPVDTVVIFFAGHGKSPLDWSAMPPSATSYDLLGSWMFFSEFSQHHITFPPLLWNDAKIEAKIIVFSLACYSGNMFNKCFADKKNCFAVCLASEDHPASFDQLLGLGMKSFFEQKNFQHLCLGDLCNKLQLSMLEHENIVLKRKENLIQSEREYEEDRIESTEFAIGDLEGYQIRKIPTDLWEIFREIEHMKITIEELRHSNVSQELTDKFDRHIDVLEWRRFDLMRMYKHKPNNKIQLCGNMDLLQITIQKLFNC